MPKLTRRKALYDCLKLWQNIHDNWSVYCGEAEGGYDISSIKILAVLDQGNNGGPCPACTYRDTHHNKWYCDDKCIIQWPGNSRCVSGEDSPYRLLNRGDLDIKYVREIIVLIKQAIAKLPPLKKGKS